MLCQAPVYLEFPSHSPVLISGTELSWMRTIAADEDGQGDDAADEEGEDQRHHQLYNPRRHGLAGALGLKTPKFGPRSNYGISAISDSRCMGANIYTGIPIPYPRRPIDPRRCYGIQGEGQALTATTGLRVS